MANLRKLGFSVALILQVLFLTDSVVADSLRLVPQKAEDSLKLLDEVEQGAGTEGEPGVVATEQKEEDLLHKLGSNIEGRVRLRGQYFTRDPDVTGIPNMDRENSFGEALLELSTWTGTKTWRIATAGWLETGNQVGTYGGVTHFMQDRERKRRYAELNEIFALISGGGFDVTFGKTLLKNGIATIYSPADRYTPKDFNDPLDSKDLGLWQFRTDYALSEQLTVTAAFLPVFQRYKEPHKNSRWLANSVDFSFPGAPPGGVDPASIVVRTDVPNLGTDNFGYFGRLNGTFAGWDFFFSPYYGLSQSFVARQDDPMIPVITKDVPHAFNLSAGFATVYKKWQFHGECLYNDTIDGEDDDYFTGVVGFNYKLDAFPKWLPMEYIELILEYAGEKILSEQDAPGFVQSSRDFRLGGNNILFGIEAKVNDDLTFQANGANQISRSDHVIHVEGKYRVREDFYFILGFDEFGGQDTDTFYGRWERNDRLTGIFEYVF